MCRLGIVKELVADEKLRIQPQLVKSAENKAGILTRVCMKWLKSPTVCSALSVSEVRERHNKHHFCFKKTKYFVQAENEETPDSLIQGVINDCTSMQINRSRFNPLGCAKKWERIEMDVTHFNRAPYLTMIECGPSRFAIWLKLKSEEAKQVALVLDEIFHVRGPVSELLLDNSPCFRSQWIKEVCEKWSVILIFRCAYRPSGNGIIERNHRTIKRAAVRAKIRSPGYGILVQSSPR